MKVEEIAEAIAKLRPDQLARFRRWFAAFEAGRSDHAKETARSGRSCFGARLDDRHPAASSLGMTIPRLANCYSPDRPRSPSHVGCR
jgi:hypothetical protein